MDKEQATHFIRNRLDQGMELDAISIELSKLVNAPQELITRFVWQVASSFPTEQSLEHPFPSPQQELEPATHAMQKEPAQPHMDDPESILAQPVVKEDEIASRLHPPSDPRTTVERPSSPQTAQAVLPNQDELVNLVVQNTKKHHKYSNIVETVCTETGWSWNDAQRFVARIQTDNQEQIAKSQRSFMIPFSVGFIIGGFLLLLWSILASFDYYSALTNHTQSTLSVELLPFTIAGYVTSLSLITGGLYGLYRISSEK